MTTLLLLVIYIAFISLEFLIHYLGQLGQLFTLN